MVESDSQGRVHCPSCEENFRTRIKPRKYGRPACQNCGARISLKTVHVQKRGLGWIGQERMYCCPKCGIVLGFSYWESR